MTTDISTGEMFETDGSSVVVRHMIAKINGIVPKILFPFVAKQDIRYYLNGINIRPLIEGGVMISASDGHRLIVVRDPEGFVDREIIVSVLKDGLKHGTADGEFIVMSDGASWWAPRIAAAVLRAAGQTESRELSKRDERQHAHEARRWCSGDSAWSEWQPCTAEQAASYAKDETFQVRAALRATGGEG